MLTASKKISTLFFVITIVGIFSSAVHARSIGGWGVSYSSIKVHADLSGVKNPSVHPSVGVVDTMLEQIEYYCFNPSNYNVAPGSSGFREIMVADAIDEDNILGKGQGTLDLTFEVPGPFNCVNTNWEFLENSEVAKVISITITWYECSGDAKTEADGDACFEQTPDGTIVTVEETPIDEVKGLCTLNTVLRNDDYTVVEGQTYTCTEL